MTNTNDIKLYLFAAKRLDEELREKLLAARRKYNEENTKFEEDHSYLRGLIKGFLKSLKKLEEEGGELNLDKSIELFTEALKDSDKKKENLIFSMEEYEEIRAMIKTNEAKIKMLEYSQLHSVTDISRSKMFELIREVEEGNFVRKEGKRKEGSEKHLQFFAENSRDLPNYMREFVEAWEAERKG